MTREMFTLEIQVQVLALMWKLIPPVTRVPGDLTSDAGLPGDKTLKRYTDRQTCRQANIHTHGKRI